MEKLRGIDKLKASVDQRLLQIREQNRWRGLETISFGENERLNLSHNDYLNLRCDREFQSRAIDRAKHWPCGSGASRLLGGEHGIYSEMEKAFASWKGAESALYFTSGYAANEAVMVALAQSDACFFSDSLNHASLIDGMILARLDPSRRKIFRHNDLNHLEDLLKSSTASMKWIVTEGLFSMDGDFGLLRELSDLASRHHALLVVDEAHSLGLFGPAGQGWLAELGISHENVLTINPCGKAMGVAGALVAGPTWFRDYLINTARSFIFSTGTSPWVAAALAESIESMKSFKLRRTSLQISARKLREVLKGIGFDIGLSQSHIIPIILGSEQRAIKAEAWLRHQGIRVKAIRPPTVAQDSSRLRMSLHAGIEEKDIDFLSLTFEKLYEKRDTVFCDRNGN